MSDQAAKLRQMTLNNSIPKGPISKKGSKCRIIAVTSGKGGVGKTNFTVNLALSLAALRQKVLVVDAGLGMANVVGVLGCLSPRNIPNFSEGELKIADVVNEGPRGVKFLAGGSGYFHLANLNDDRLKHVVSQIALFDNWADIVLIDTGVGLSHNVLNYILAADEVIIITTPDPTAITDTYVMIKAYAGQNGDATLRLVVNRIFGLAEGQLVADKIINTSHRFLELSINNLGYVYEDRNMLKAVKNQTPVVIKFPDAISSRCIDNIAQRLLYGKRVKKS